MENIDLMSNGVWYDVFNEMYKKRAIVFTLSFKSTKLTVKLMNLLHFISIEYFYDLESMLVEGDSTLLNYKITRLDKFRY